MNDENLLKLGSLLHDMGKLGYRAGERGVHEEIGKNLVLQYDDFLPGVSSLISMHHRHGIENLFNQEGYLVLKEIIIADWLASSERIGLEQSKDAKKVGLTPIFSEVSIFKQREHRNFYYLGKNLVLEDDSKEIFPQIEEKVSSLLESNFLENWNLFKEKLGKIKEYKEDYEKIFELLFSLLKQSFKFLPSAAYRVEPDISLFDHSKMVCALAVALHNYFATNSFEEKEVLEILNQIGQILQELYRVGDSYVNEIGKNPSKKEIFEEKKLFSLIHGDFSGIQNFIHLISSKHAMKTLKGRSFFFSLLTENFARYIVQELKLTEANIIFAGGGHFYIIGYYSNDLEIKIKELSKTINKLFIEHFNSNLYLALSFIPLSIRDLIYEKFSNSWREVNLKTSVKKRKKFYENIEESKEDYFSEIFGPFEDSANKIERCIVCNSFNDLELVTDEREDKWCSMCRSFMDLTNDLKTSNYYKIVKKSDKSYNRVLVELNNASIFKDIVKENQNYWYSINKPMSENVLGDKLFPIAFPIHKEGLKKDRIIDNDDLAEQAFERTGFNKLGILKMDVDSLGRIFQRGLGDNSTISRISTLSSSLTLFFEGYVPKLVQTEFSDSVYLIFSGGDDLFAVGSWDKIIEFSYRLYKDFRRFTAFNPDITLSAGIAIETPTFPIIKASLAAEEELDRAKNFEPFTGKTNTKNRISLFGSVLKWDWTYEKEEEFQNIKQKVENIEKHRRDQLLKIMKNDGSEKINEEIFNWINNKSEFELAVILKEIFVYLLKKKDFSKSMLHKVENSVWGMRTLLEDSLERKIRVPKLWRLKYYLRSVLWSKDSEVKLLCNFIVQMFEIIIKNNLFIPDSNLQIKNVEFISVAVKWADYLTRK